MCLIASIIVVRPILKRVRQQAARAYSEVAIRGFGTAITEYRKYYRDFPRVTWGEMFKVLSGENVRGQNPSNLVFWSGNPEDAQGPWAEDGWGMPLSFSIRTNEVRVWSSGPNRKDEAGAEDDFLIAIPADKLK